MIWEGVFDAVGEIVAAPDEATVAGAAHRAACALGFASIGYTNMDGATIARDGRPMLVCTHAPGWAATYLDREFWRDDPVVAAARSRVRPFRPLSLDDPGRLSARQRDALYSLVEFGATDEVAVPVRGGVADGLVSFATDQVIGFDARFLQDRGPALAVLSNAVHLRMMTFGFGDAPAKEVLTPMQRACLRWAARGKTSGETGSILGVNEVTVRRHHCAAMQRLGAVTVTQAVAQAVRLGLVDL